MTSAEDTTILSPLAPDAPGAPEAPWKARFFTIWTGQALSLIGSGLTQFALVWWLTVSSGSATVLAIATLMALLPQIVLGPFAGVLADRWNRRLILMLADGLIALATLVLLVIWLGGNMQPWQIYVVMLVRSAGSAFHQPTMTASTTMLVPKWFLTRVNGLNQMVQGISTVLAPVLGALLLQFSNLGIVLGVDIVTALFAIVPLFFFAIPQPATREEGRGPVVKWVMRDLREGIHYVGANRGLKQMFVVALAINFVVVPSMSLLPLLVNKVYGGDAQALAMTEVFFGLGAIAGGIGIAAWGGFKSKILTSLLGVSLMGTGMAIIGLAPVQYFWLLVLGCLLIGVAVSASNGPMMAVFQTVVAPDMQARVFSLLITAAIGVAPIGLLLAGPFADWFGPRAWYVMTAVACVVIALIAANLKTLRALEFQPVQALVLDAGAQTDPEPMAYAVDAVQSDA